MLPKALRKLDSEAELLLPPSAVTRFEKLDSSCVSVESLEEVEAVEAVEVEEELVLRLAVSLLIRLCRSELIWPGPPDAEPIPSDDELDPELLVVELCACSAAIRLCMKVTMAWATLELELSEPDDAVVERSVPEVPELVVPVLEVDDVAELTLRPRLDSACMTELIMPPPPPWGGGPGGGPMGAVDALPDVLWVPEVDCNCDSHA